MVINNTINISFSQDGGTAIGDAVPITPPSGLVNVGTGKYLNITNYTAAWMFLNISYNDDELDLINESSLKIWRWNGTVWNDTGFADIVGVDEANNIVYANIINFSVFGAFGQPLVPGINITVNSTSATIVVNVNASYLVTIGNNGTAAGTYNLTVQNLTAASDVMALNQSNITLAAGATGSVLLSVGNGAAGEFNVTVIASLSTNASINATTPVITTTVQAAAPPPTAWYPTSSQSCTRRSLNCANWSACIEQGVQNRTCTYSTAACTLEPVNETQNCIYTSPVPPFAPPCTEDWRCDDWSACTDNEQERSCADRNACNTTVNKLAESQACIMPVPLVGPVCGDGTCESGEDYETCPADCVMPVPAPALPELDVIAIMTISMIVAIAGFGLAVRSMLRKRTKRRFKRKPIKQRYAFSLPR